MKNLNFNTIFIYILYSFLIVSCSSESKQADSPQKAYSIETQKAFEDIEFNDIHPKPSAPVPSKVVPKPISIVKNQVHEKPKEAIKEVPHIELSAKNQERLQEINQNLAFFCMKHRKDKLFSDEDHCLAFTKKVLKTCEEKHTLINTVMVNCIKELLKKRH